MSKRTKPFTSSNEILTEILGHAPAKSKTNPKSFDCSTPTRLSHLTELIEHRPPLASQEMFLEAYSKLNASRWLKKPARDITPEELEALTKAAPWEHYKPKRGKVEEEFVEGTEYTGHLFPRGS